MIRAFILSILAGVACLGASGVDAQARPDASALIGTWTASEASGRIATLTFSKGGVFEIEFRGDEVVDVSGHYQVVNGDLTVTDENGLAACVAPDFRPGRYAFTIRDGDLALDAIQDDCDGRAIVLQRRGAAKRTWTKKKIAGIGG